MSMNPYDYDLCEACWHWNGSLMECDDSCKDHTDHEWKRRIYGPNYKNRQLLKNGRKP